MQLPIRISNKSREPIYHQIETQLKSLIVGGQLPAGAPLPSIRSLAADLACSVITTRRAYQNLEAEGYIETLQGKGTFVAHINQEDRNRYREESIYEAFEKAIEISLRAGVGPDEIREMFERVLRDLGQEQ